jgi:hypothetical protein
MPAIPHMGEESRKAKVESRKKDSFFEKGVERLK